MSNFLRQIWNVSWGDLLFMKHNILNITIMSVMSPVLYLIAFGFGLRNGVTDIGVSYVAFVIPGIVALSSMSSAYSSTATRLNVQRLYYRCFDEMMMCPLSNSAIVLGKCFMGFLRGLLSSGLIYILGLFLAPDLAITPIFFPCLIISCTTFSMLGMISALLAKTHQGLSTFNSLIILPMTFLCGTFFSVSSLHPVFQGILYCLPLTHASECIRAACLPTAIPQFPWISLVVLIAFGIIFFLINRHLLETRKV